jgi:eukaryotic-like serine/threonine-protein kinase
MTAPPLPTTRKVRRPDALIQALREPLPELVPGDVLGQFRIERRLGRGGMSSVYLARHVTGGARVAIKVPNPDVAHDPDARDRLATEGRMLSKLRHPNIVTLFDSSTAPNGLPYLVMEYLEGQSLSAREHMQMPVQPAVHVLMQLCDALAAFHGVGGVHRDVKPENIFVIRRLDAPLTVKLLDFGIARMNGDEGRQRATAVGAVVGTPTFMPPEQMMGETVDQRADLYALGVIGHLLLTGELPFENFREKMFQSAPSIRSQRPDVPLAFESALCRALAADPDHRFATAHELKEALSGVLVGRKHGPHAVPPPPSELKKIIRVLDQAGHELASSSNALVVPGGAWLCTTGQMPRPDQQVLVMLPGHEGLLPARIVSSALFPPHLMASLPRGFLIEFNRLETSARAALLALTSK